MDSENLVKSGVKMLADRDQKGDMKEDTTYETHPETQPGRVPIDAVPSSVRTIRFVSSAMEYLYSH